MRLVSGKSTVRKAQSPGGCGMVREANAWRPKGDRKPGTVWVGPSAGGPGDNWPDTGRSARTRRGADAGQVSLCGNTDNEVGTEGQVGHHGDANDWRGASHDGRCRGGERTGGRTPGLARHWLAGRRGRRTAFAAA